MQFDSFLFILFLGAVALVYWLLPTWSSKKVFLLGASYIFYAAWSPPLVILIWISTLTDFFLARKIYALGNVHARKLLVAVSLVINLGMLGYFKYAGFLLDAFSEIVARFGIIYHAPDFNIILPIGISFYTFQTISYTIDAYRRDIKPDHGLIDFSLYVTFFPQLVAGPIVRASQFLPQCDRQPVIRRHELVWGIYLLIFGLFAKVVLSDFILAPFADTVFQSPGMVTSLDAWVGIFAYSGEIFFDFSGYTLCALGTAMLFGFTLPDNFNSPYAAIGITDFWRRWHISLSTWLRDYLYIPLGGNRKGRFRTLVNLMTTMLLGGLWHGASWNFALWGGLHGLFLMAEHGITRIRLFRLEHEFVRIPVMLLTFMLVSLAWVPFRSVTIQETGNYYQKILSFDPGTVFDPLELTLVIVTMVVTLIWHYHSRNRTLESVFSAFPTVVRTGILACMLLGLGIASTGDSRAFIYFQF